jgi:hypothetical protein
MSTARIILTAATDLATGTLEMVSIHPVAETVTDCGS